MMHAKEEVITLLDGQLAPVPTPSQARRKKALKVLLGVVGAIVLVAGSVVAVEMVGAKSGSITAPVDVMTLKTQSGSELAPSSLESDFGWSTINNGWCSARAAAWCLFKSDKEQCKKDIHESCDSKPEEEESSDDDEDSDDDDDDDDGSGSGMGSRAAAGSNHTVAKKNQTKTHRNHTKGHRNRTSHEPSAGDSGKPMPMPTKK